MNESFIDILIISVSSRETSGRGRRGPPLRVRTAHLLSNLGRLQAKRFTDSLMPMGLRAKEFALLNQIALAEGSSQKELGGRMRLDPSGLVATIDELQRRGLVERKPHSDDRRRYALHLTEQGRAKLREGRALAGETADLLLAPLSEEEVRQLHDLLARLEAAGHGEEGMQSQALRFGAPAWPGRGR
jgi:DNA-binding MarR family transcriptional regulator